MRVLGITPMGGRSQNPTPYWLVTARALVFVTSLSSPAVLANSLSFHAEFDLLWHTIVFARITWSVESTTNSTTVFTSHTVPSTLGSFYDDGKIIERSEWIEEAGQLYPLLYSYSRSGRKSRQVDIRFDWEARIAHHNANDKRWQLEIVPGTLDKLSYVIAAMADLSRGKKDINYTVANGKILKRYRLKNLGEDSIETSLGVLDTVILHYKNSNNRETTFWCAPKFRYLPVRLIHRSRGLEFESVIRSLDMQPLAMNATK